MLCCYSSYIIFAMCSFIGIYLYTMYKKSKVLSKLKDKHIVITGGSQGIGKSAGIEAAKNGSHVTILARNENNLKIAQEEIKQACLNSKQEITYYKCDVTQFDELQNLITNIDNQKPIDILLNCAGMAICGPIEDLKQTEVINLVNLNLLGTYFATKAIVPLMKLRNSGIIILTSSQAALAGIYGFGIYTATKFGLRGLAETLNMELKPYNVSVTLSLPPDTDTPGFERENVGKPKETMLICESGGLFKPEVVAKRMLQDSLMGNFFSYTGFESFLLTTLCCGMTPCDNIIQLLIQIVLLGPIRLITIIISKQFERIVKKCKEERETAKTK